MPLDHDAALTHRIIGLAMKVHTGIGPGLRLNFNVVPLKDGIRRQVLSGG